MTIICEQVLGLGAVLTVYGGMAVHVVHCQVSTGQLALKE